MKWIVTKSKQHRWLAGLLAATLTVGMASATERIFTYTYEPETLPKGAWEFEQWVTWRGDRNKAVEQDNYSRWDFREEFEYAVTDRYTVSLYGWQGRQESFRDPSTGHTKSDFHWEGVSVENIYMVLNPAENPVGLSLYIEPRASDREAELEQKIIIGQRCGDWKWAMNFVHASEWNLNNGMVEGEVEFDFGLSRQIGKRWWLGFELRDHNELPEYDKWENSAIYLGPVVSYHAERWWATLSVMPQIYGTSFQQNPDREVDLELEGHEKLNVRLIVGISF